MRFRPLKNGDSFVIEEGRQTFVQRSKKQMRRSNRRLGQFRESYETRSKTNVSKMRSTDESVEMKRSEKYENDVTNITDSPVVVVDKSMSSGDTSSESCKKYVLHHYVPSSSDESLPLSSTMSDEKLQNQVIEEPVSIPMPKIESSSSESDCMATCDDESDPYSGSCSDDGCSYVDSFALSSEEIMAKSERLNQIRRYVCKRCISAGDHGLYVCVKCARRGKHKRHKHYLDLEPPCVPPDSLHK